MSDQEDLLDHYVQHVLDACRALHDEVAGLPPDEREVAEHRNFYILEEIRLNEREANEIRVRLVTRAREAYGNEFAAWVDGLMTRFSGSNPPLSIQRLKNK